MYTFLAQPELEIYIRCHTYISSIEPEAWTKYYRTSMNHQKCITDGTLNK